MPPLLVPSPDIDARYAERTPRSAALMQRAAASMSDGVTRSLSWFDPYPVVFERGHGATLVDVDGNGYIDLMMNGLSLIHGHGYEPIREAVTAATARGSAWPGASDQQIEFAELLCSRIAHAERVRFANTGTEATMLAVKLARFVTGRPIIVKAVGGFHGSYDDLEAGLHGSGPVPGRVELATFGDVHSFGHALDHHAGQVAAIIVESVMYTDGVVEPPPGFLPDLERLARGAGVLLILDDCLMFRLAEGGSAERFGFTPDITVLGKWIGGGLPAGAVLASAELMSAFSPHAERQLYHGGSFNGNLLSCAAGRVAVAHLTAERIAETTARALRLRASISRHGADLGLGVETRGDGAAFGVYLVDADGEIDWPLTRRLQLAAVTRGIYLGSAGEAALATVLTDAQADEAAGLLAAALDDVAASLQTTPSAA